MNVVHADSFPIITGREDEDRRKDREQGPYTKAVHPRYSPLGLEISA